MSFKNEFELKYVADYGTAKIEADILNSSNYISTDNLIPEKGGKVNSDYLPIKGKVSKYSKGDTLVSNIRPYFKKILFAKEIGGCSNDVIVFKPKLDKIDPQYLYYQLSKDDFFDFMMAGANGTKMPRGNKKSIPTYKIFLHPLPTQRKIAKILSAYDDLIDNNLKRIKLLEEIAQRTYEEWFVKFRVNGEQLPVDENTGLPVGWVTKRLEDCIYNFDNKRKPLAKLIREDRKGVFPYYGAAGIIDYIDGFIFEGRYLLIGEDGTVITPSGVAMLQFVEGKFWVSNHAHVVTGKGKISTEFIYCFLNQYPIGQHITGAAQPKISQMNLNRIEVFIGTDSTMKNFNSIILPIINQVFYIKNKNQRLKESRDILLPKLMNGTINVE